MAADLKAEGAVSLPSWNSPGQEVKPGMEMEEQVRAGGLEAEGERMVPRVIQVGTIGEFLGWAAPQELIQGPEEGAAQRWEAQWQEVLRAVQLHPAGCGSPQQSKPLLWSNTKTSGEVATDTSQCLRREGIMQLLVDNNGVVTQVFSHPEMGENKMVDEEVVTKNSANSEMQRQRFRQFGYQEAEGPREVCKKLWELCRLWLKPESCTKEEILELLILEQFLTVLPQEMQSWVKKRCPQACCQAVALAEEFLRAQPQEVKDLGPCKEVVVISSEAELSPLSSRPGRFCGKVQLEDGWTLTSSGKDRRLNIYPVSPSEGIANGNKLGLSEQGGSPLPVLLGTLLGPAESSCALEGEHKMELSRRWDEATCCSEGVYETVVRLEEQGHWCLECGESFQDALQLSGHQKIHMNRKRPECPECGKSFRDLSHVLRHQTVHTGEKPYTCPECGQSFTQKPALNRHMRKHLESQHYTGFATFDSGVRHRRTHTNRKRPECLECGKSFRDVSQVLRHQTVHTGEKPFSCSECGQSFTQKPALNRHLRKHLESQYYTVINGDEQMNEKVCFEPIESQHMLSGTFYESISSPFPPRCPLETQPVENHPGEPLPSKSGALEVVKTKQSRRGQKNYWCFLCTKGFRDKADLVRHQRIHTGEKPFVCLDCGRRFSTTSSLYKHQTTHRRSAPQEEKS
ncbi:zinc finger and SCAN domain-containing protein 21-like isoform X2 [Tiliqua scincoides]|uniref:zinc finger and SCAN domain-containing protein 21-like isoform X2 n=1 Tax=Tiliqua scincoides TaxID=71010 RepID=UPI003462CAF1